MTDPMGTLPIENAVMLNLIRPGDNSRAVCKLQRALSLAIDGDFGPRTELAVKTFQTNARLSADGLVGPSTIAALKLDMRPDLAVEADFVATAQFLGVSVAHVKAVAEVETRAAPFWADGNTPILFERHVMYQRCVIPRKAGETKLELARQRDTLWTTKYANVCQKTAGGYGASSAQYGRLEMAKQISETAALESASWGTFQVMGYHATDIGWKSVQAFVRAMQASQYDHLRAFSGWIRANPAAHAALKAKDWATFARLYNGPNYAVNKYDVKMRDAYKKYGGV